MQFDEIKTSELQVGDYIKYNDGISSAGTVSSVAPLTVETRDQICAVDPENIEQLTRLNVTDYMVTAWQDVTIESYIMYMTDDVVRAGGKVRRHYKFYGKPMIELYDGANIWSLTAQKVQKIWTRINAPTYTEADWSDVKVGNRVRYLVGDKYFYGSILKTHKYYAVMKNDINVTFSKTEKVWVRSGYVKIELKGLPIQKPIMVDYIMVDAPKIIPQTETKIAESAILVSYKGDMPPNITIGLRSHTKMLKLLGIDGYMRFLWNYSDVYVGITNQHIFKLENGKFTIVLIADIIRTEHVRNGLFAWDNIVFRLKDRLVSIGVYDGASVEFILLNLRASA